MGGGDGHVERNMAGDAIDGALPAQPAVQAHFRTVPHADVAAALAAVEASGAAAATKLCFRFLVLTAVRSVEAREAVWSEVDLEARTWTVPAERMKSNREHVVPLSDGALAVLAATAELREAGSDLVFPGVRHGRPLSDATLSKLLKEIGVPAVPHGFRAGPGRANGPTRHRRSWSSRWRMPAGRRSSGPTRGAIFATSGAR